MNRVVGIIFDDIERANMVQLFRVHSSRDQNWYRLKEYFILDLPEIYETDLDLTDQGRELKLEQHWELKMLWSSLLFDVDLMLVNALVRGPIDALIGANRIFRWSRLEDHSFS